jgi:type IV fimbrial biogenesis protein FimT
MNRSRGRKVRALPRSGFTMVEMMIVLVIVAILAAIGLPTYRLTIASIRMSGEVNSVVGNLNFARSEALKRGAIVSVCPGSGTTCSTGSDWSSGWIVVLNGPPAQQLQTSAGVAHGDVLTSVTSSSPAYPQFTPMGYMFFTGTLTLHDPDSTASLYRCINITAGSWTVQQGASCP